MQVSVTLIITKAGKNFLHPGRQAAIFYKDVKIGEIGEVHPLVMKNYGIGERTYEAVLDLNAVTPFATLDRKYVGVPRYPAR